MGNAINIACLVLFAISLVILLWLVLRESKNDPIKVHDGWISYNVRYTSSLGPEAMIRNVQTGIEKHWLEVECIEYLARANAEAAERRGIKNDYRTVSELCREIVYDLDKKD